MMFSAILVPLDGSPLAEQALPIAARLARASGSALHLVHVHEAASPDPIMIEGMPVIDDQMRSLGAEHERVYLERAAAQVAADGFTPTIARLMGPVVQALAEYARDSGVGLIVMTTHGRSGLLHLWLGSVAESLVRSAAAPMLLLRPDADGLLAKGPFKRLLVPLDGSSLAEEILPHAAELARIDGGELELLQVADAASAPEAERYLDQTAAGTYPVPVGRQVRVAEDPARAITEIAGAIDADLVALTTHGTGAAPRSGLGSIADMVLRAGVCSLLVLRPAGHAAD